MEAYATGKYKMNIKEFGNIAIFQTAFIGDVVLTMPLLQSVRNENPDAKITFITTPQAREIPELCTASDEVIVFDKRGKHSGFEGLFEFIKLLKNKKYDLWISAHRSFRSSIISSFSSDATKISFKNSSLSFLYDHKIAYQKHLHEIERNLELLSPFGIKSKVHLKDVETSVNSVKIDSIYDNGVPDYKYVVIAPGSVWETKKWCEEYFVDLSKMFLNSGIKVYLSGSKSDGELCNRISKKSGAISLAGLTNITQTLHLIQSARLVVTNDSAPTHFAGLMNTPVITIFGPTSPIFGFGPRSDKSAVIRNEALKCSPCRIHGSEKCPISTHECMKSVKPEVVFEQALMMIQT